MGAAFIRRNGVDFIDDDGPDRLQYSAAFLCRQEDVERLRRGDEDMRRPFEHLLALRHRRVAGADQYTEFRHQEPGRQRGVADFSEWLLEIFLDVVAERFQRRDVEHLRMVIEFTREGLLEEVIDAGEKGGERLAGTGRRSNQNISPRLNGRPSLNLDIGRGTRLTTETIRR